MAKIKLWGEKCLTTPCDDITQWDEKLNEAAMNMSFLLDQDSNAVAIAANQIGCPFRFFIYVDEDGEHVLIVNPMIRYAENILSRVEGCLSLPGVTTVVARADTVEVQYHELATGNTVVKTVSGLTARIFQHEIDHLSGLMLTDRVSEAEKYELLGRYGKLSPNHRPATKRTGSNRPRR